MTPKLFQGDKWLTKDGRKLDPTEMTLKHLHNTLRFIKKEETLTAYHTMACIEQAMLPEPHGDAAIDAYEREQAVLHNMPLPKFFELYIKPSNLYRALESACKQKELEY